MEQRQQFSQPLSPLFKEQDRIDVFCQETKQTEIQKIQQGWDDQVGIILLYNKKTMEKLVRCYPVWGEMPQKEEVRLMINGGCVFYQYSIISYVYGLGLKNTEHKGRDIKDEEWPQLISWFSRFADLLVRGNYNQEWYKKILKQYKFSTEHQYRKSFFGILANIAYCILKSDEEQYINQLTAIFKQILKYEVQRDYQNEQQLIQKGVQQLLQIYQESEKNKLDTQPSEIAHSVNESDQK